MIRPSSRWSRLTVRALLASGSLWETQGTVRVPTRGRNSYLLVPGIDTPEPLRYAYLLAEPTRVCIPEARDADFPGASTTQSLRTQKWLTPLFL
eukprot:1041455-Rhodomonas_salina.1